MVHVSTKFECIFFHMQRIFNDLTTPHIQYKIWNCKMYRDKNLSKKFSLSIVIICFIDRNQTFNNISIESFYVEVE